jgi:hypothetical protein
MLKRWQKWSSKVVNVEETIKSLNYYLQQIEKTDNLDSLRSFNYLKK